jgi:hypothetical protein
MRVKDCGVIDLRINIPFHSPGFELIELASEECLRITSDTKSGAKHHFPLFWGRRRFIENWNAGAVWDNPAIGAYLHFNSGASSCVFPSGLRHKGERENAVWRSNSLACPAIASIWRNPSPLGRNSICRRFRGIASNFDGFLHVAGLGYGVLAKQRELLLSGQPKFIGSEPQTDSGDGKDNGESANDTFVVPLKPVIRCLEHERRSRVEGGAVFFIIVIGGLLTVLWLYQAQR